MRLINADDMVKSLMDMTFYDEEGHMIDDYEDRLAIVKSFVDPVQTVDAEPVIRCKDCKYYRDGDCWHEWDNDGQIYYQSVINEPNPDDYCSRAERREE